jgi:hypothetical protein
VQTPYADFGPGRVKFVRLVKDALPDDEVIQGLKDGWAGGPGVEG